MRGLLNKLLTILLILLLTIQPVSAQSFDERVTDAIRGGAVATKSKAIWELQRYKEIDLMRKAPMKWCPYKAYITVYDNVSIYGYNNLHWISIDADLMQLLSAEAQANKAFAKRFPTHGKRKQQVRQIWRWCKRTKYVFGVKFASDVFTKRQGDCAAISAAFYVLCKAKHIPVRYVIGWTPSGCHAWNRVKIGKQWYWIDCTHGRWIQKKQYENRHILEMW